MARAEALTMPSPAPISTQLACISLIVPVWRDGGGVIALLKRLESFPEIREIIVSGGEPAGDLQEKIERLGGLLGGSTKPNRGPQLNAGGQVACGDCLLFRHADSETR